MASDRRLEKQKTEKRRRRKSNMILDLKETEDELWRDKYLLRIE
jgi:hypothetical protein